MYLMLTFLCDDNLFSVADVMRTDFQVTCLSAFGVRVLNHQQPRTYYYDITDENKEITKYIK